MRQERPNGMQTRPVDHFTESGIEPSTRPSDAITHETADHFLVAHTGLFAGWNGPKKCGNVMCLKHSGVFRFSPSRKICARVVSVGTKEMSCLSQHKSMPFGSTSAVYGWHRVGCLLKDIMVCVSLAPCCRFVDDFFGVEPARCDEYTGGFCLSQSLQPAGISH